MSLQFTAHAGPGTGCGCGALIRAPDGRCPPILSDLRSQSYCGAPISRHAWCAPGLSLSRAAPKSVQRVAIRWGAPHAPSHGVSRPTPGLRGAFESGLPTQICGMPFEFRPLNAQTSQLPGDTRRDASWNRTPTGPAETQSSQSNATSATGSAEFALSLRRLVEAGITSVPAHIKERDALTSRLRPARRLC